MKKASRYIPSLILSVILVFALAGTISAFVFSLCFTRENALSIAEKNNTSETVMLQLEKYYAEKQHSSGIPAEVYMDSLNADKIDEIISYKINDGFDKIEGKSDNVGNYYEISDTVESIESFFSEYADENGIPKDEVYDEKLKSTVESAEKTIESQCDVYKFETLESQNILSKASGVMKYIQMIMTALVIADAVVMLLIFAVNHKEKTSFFYWTGISALISGVVGIIPSVYLICSGFFNSFTIKQPQVFSVYTSAMTGFTKVFMYSMTVLILLGILLLAVYSVCEKKKSKK